MSRTAVPRRLTALIVVVCVAGGVVLLAAGWQFLSSADAQQLLGVVALTAAATLAERFPVPISPEGGAVLSLTFLLPVAALVLYGSAAGALLVLLAPVIVQSAQHLPSQPIVCPLA